MNQLSGDNLAPVLRFVEFTSLWRLKKISDLFTVSAGGDIESHADAAGFDGY